ncbi:hypothetical protein [Amycolatopsis oliviviridis]
MSQEAQVTLAATFTTSAMDQVVPRPTHDGLTASTTTPGSTVYSPVEPVRAVPLADGGGVAFVTEAYTGNVLNAFPEPRPGVFRVVAHHDNGTIGLADEPGRRLVPHTLAQFLDVLTHLPPHVAAWNTYTDVELWACDLTATQHSQLAVAARAAFGTGLTLPHPGRLVHIAPDGDIRTTTTVPGDLPAGTLTLGPKRKAAAPSGESSRKRTEHAIDADDPDQLAAVALKVLQEHGDMDIRSLLVYMTGEGVPSSKKGSLRTILNNARETLRETDGLWRPTYRGKEIGNGTFDAANPDDLTVWLWRRAVARPNEDATAIARAAEEAGFSGKMDQLIANARLAISTAELDDRRDPVLQVREPEHRPRIESLIEILIASHDKPTANSIFGELRKRNVQGSQAELLNLLNEAFATPRTTRSALQAIGGHLSGPQGKTFLGRELNADNPHDHDLIGKLAYAAAWSDKTIGPDHIATRMAHEGITGSQHTLTELVTQATHEATLNGDRLVRLSADNPDHHDAIQARLGGIVIFKGELRDADRLPELVKAMRTRHITGPQEELRQRALDFLHASTARLLVDPDFAIDTSFVNLDLSAESTTAPEETTTTPARKLNPEDPRHQTAIAELARQVVDEHGNIGKEALRFHLSQKGVDSTKKGIHPAITRARQQASADGSTWHPVYRASKREEVLDLDTPNDLTVALWQLAIDHPTENAATIARLAEQSGFASKGSTMVKAAEAAIEVAEKHRRRHPAMSIKDAENLDPINSLINAILTIEPHLKTPEIIRRLHRFNVRGDTGKLEKTVNARRREHHHDPGAEPAARELLTLRPEPLFLGRHLNADNPRDHDLIGKLAYAAAWSDKTIGPDHIATRMAHEGITGSQHTLTELVTQATHEATLNGDRLADLPAGLPENRDAVSHRVGEIVRFNPWLRELPPSERITALVTQMRIRHITGSGDALREHAEAVYDDGAGLPPDTTTFTVAASGGPVQVIPFSRGAAFVKATYAPHVLNAFPHASPGTLRIVVPREHHLDGAFLLPGADGNHVPHDARQLFDVIAAFPLDWDQFGHLELWTGVLTRDHETHLNDLIRGHGHLGHLELVLAARGRTVYITRDGRNHFAQPPEGFTGDVLALSVVRAQDDLEVFLTGAEPPE